MDWNYRLACRAKSTADFINKLKNVEEEADETLYWLEILEESGFIQSERVKEIKSEVDEIISIVVASIKTSRRKKNKRMLIADRLVLSKSFRSNPIVNQKSKIVLPSRYKVKSKRTLGPIYQRLSVKRLQDQCPEQIHSKGYTHALKEF